MPIIGLTDKAASFPRLGELRKGAEKPATGNRPGADLNDKFRFTSKIDGMEKLFSEEFGGTPNNILCYLPYQTTDENFPAWVEEWAAGGLKWRGDGVNLVLWQKEDGTYSTDTRPQPAGGKGSAKLHLIIPALKRMGYVVALTTSLNDMIEISANLRAYESMRGDLRGIPFILSRVPRMISTPSGNDGKRARREKWLMHLEIVPDYTAAQLEATARAAMPHLVSSSMPALSSGESVNFETGEIVNGEDYHTGEPEPEPTTPPLPKKQTATQTKQFHAIGKEVYGDEWKQKRGELVKYITDGLATSSKHLTYDEAQKLIDGMKDKQTAVNGE